MGPYQTQMYSVSTATAELYKLMSTLSADGTGILYKLHLDISTLSHVTDVYRVGQCCTNKARRNIFSPLFCTQNKVKPGAQ